MEIKNIEQALHKHNHSHLSIVKTGDDGYKSVEHGQLIAPAYKAIGEIDEKYSSEVRKLKGRLDKVEKELEELKGAA